MIKRKLKNYKLNHYITRPVLGGFTLHQLKGYIKKNIFSVKCQLKQPIQPLQIKRLLK